VCDVESLKEEATSPQKGCEYKPTMGCSAERKKMDFFAVKFREPFFHWLFSCYVVGWTHRDGLVSVHSAGIRRYKRQGYSLSLFGPLFLVLHKVKIVMLCFLYIGLSLYNMQCLSLVAHTEDYLC
jgi:hypothetical protein